MVTLKGEQISIDGYLQKKLENIKKIIEKNWDCVILIDGEERSGKSTLGKTIACYLNPDFSVNNISNSVEETKKKIAELPDKKVLLIDEGSLVFSSKDAMLKAQKELLKILDVVGQKNMTLIIILPSVFDLIKQIAIRRSRFLLHVYTDRDMNRGRFLYFGKRKKAKLYELGKKNFGSYKKPRADFRGRFTMFNPFGKEYDSLKKKTLLNTLQTQEFIITPTIERHVKIKLMKQFKENCPEIEHKIIMKGFGTSKTCFYRDLRIYEGAKYEIPAVI